MLLLVLVLLLMLAVSLLSLLVSVPLLLLSVAVCRVVCVHGGGVVDDADVSVDVVVVAVDVGGV
eukprot:13248847-Alexandrium_andersonii.AAC.1